MFVYLEYTPSLKTAVVEHTRIHCSPMERFNPKDVNDFSRARTYYVRSCHKDKLYEAIKVIHITETLEEMAMFRAARPRRQADVETNDHEMSITPVCRDQEHMEELERQEEIDAALVEYGVGPLPGGALADMQRKLQAVTEEVDRLRRQGRCSCIPAAPVAEDVVPRSTYAQLQRKYESLMERVRHLVRREREFQILQKYHRNHSEQRPDRAATASNVPVAAVQEEMVTEEQVPNGSTSKQDEASLEPGASEGEHESADVGNLADRATEHKSVEYPCREGGIKTPRIGSAREDGKIHVGEDVWIKKRDWAELFSAPTDLRFCSIAASIFWTPKELSERSVTGTASKLRTSEGTWPEARPPLTPEKLDSLKDLFRIYVGKDPLAARRLGTVRRHLSSKICEVRRSMEGRKRAKNSG
uniref:Glycine rich superfamily member n=1 Tax=Rhipicephalus appendiculatus TaxID=34631 RepID=A0A131YXY6_RHIAP